MNPGSKEIEELSDGWVRCRSKSNQGRQYFFNRKTGKSSWSQPQPGEKPNKKAHKKVPKQNHDKKRVEEERKKSVKRKSDGANAEFTKKKHKQETLEKFNKKQRSKSVEYNGKSSIKTESPSKRRSFNDHTQKINLTKINKSPSKVTTPKNLASSRLSQLRAQLNVEARNEVDNESSSKKTRISPKPEPNETSIRLRTEASSPTANESFGSTRSKSPSSDNFYSIPLPSQFLAANKIICSMKAQLPQEYCTKSKPKDTFADIEHGICSQMTEYPVIKHPSTPPQFSEASKLVSAIKSKLSYSPKDIKIFSSAKNRMESLRASISGEIDERDLQDDYRSYSVNSQVVNQVANQLVTNDPSTKSRSSQAEISESQKCEAMEVEDIIDEVPKHTFQPKDKDPDCGQVVLVVDTNIFIHELDFIKNVLNSHIEGYSEEPMLLVPWRVINELDRLKDNNNGNGAICKRARAAMDYLYKCLPENSRIKGQSLRDANSHIYPCELPDDEILNCALQQAERGKNVLLLSNDRNLCNKATVNGIKRYSTVELKPLVQHKPRPASDPDLRAHLRHYQHTIYQLLANILENEMRAKYNNLWQHVLFKAPPWQLDDVLQCLLKHWFAVFSEVFPRIEHLITDLKNTHGRIEGKDPKTLTESEVNNFKELCLDVAQKCQIIPEYMELAKLTADRLSRRASETDDERARQTVLDAFEALWTVFSSYCAKLATALGVSHSVEDKIPTSETLGNLTGKFDDFSHSILNFILTIEGVLRIENTTSMDERITRLEAAFGECLRLTSHENRLTREDLRGFCLTDRNMLQQAMSKFSQLAHLLDACKDRLSRID